MKRLIIISMAILLLGCTGHVSIGDQKESQNKKDIEFQQTVILHELSMRRGFLEGMLFVVDNVTENGRIDPLIILDKTTRIRSEVDSLTQLNQKIKNNNLNK